jgi:hypothetical protein
MGGGRRARAVLAVSGAMITLAPAAPAAAASLTLHAPRKVGAAKYFYVHAKGTGKKSTNYLALFYTLQSSCPSTYAAAIGASHTFQIQTTFVSKKFKLKLGPVHGGASGNGRFCGYLYPKASGSAWAFKKPEAAAARRIKFT